MDYEKIGKEILADLKAHGTQWEKGFATEKDFVDDHMYQYKSTYRIMSWLIAPGLVYRDTYFNNKVVSFENAKKILAHIHPYFQKLLNDPDALETIKHNYEAMIYAWGDDK